MKLKNLKHGNVVRVSAYGARYDVVVDEVTPKNGFVDRGFSAIYFRVKDWTRGGFFERPTHIKLLHEDYTQVAPPEGWPK